MTDYIGLGATVGLSTERRRLFFNKIFSLYPDKIKFHGFGITDSKLIINYPWYSIDSTTAQRWSIFGRLPTPYGLFYTMGKGRSRIDSKLGNITKDIIMTYFESIGIKYDDLIGDKKLNTNWRVLAHVLYMDELGKQAPKSFIKKYSSLLDI
jgi:hypothetical protein